MFFRYFYPSNVLVKMDGYEERVEHEEELLAIMEVYTLYRYCTCIYTV